MALKDFKQVTHLDGHFDNAPPHPGCGMNVGKISSVYTAIQSVMMEVRSG